MCIRLRSVFMLSGLLLLAGCADNLGTEKISTQTMIQRSMAAMGGVEKLKTIQTIVLKGSGTETWLGEGFKAGDSGPASTLNIVEVYDYAKGRAALEYDLASSANMGFFNSHRREGLTKYGEGAAAQPVAYVMRNYGGFGVFSPGGFHGFSPHPSPEVAMRRSYLAIVSDISSTVVEGEMTEDREFGGKMLKFGTAKTKQGEPLGLYFDPETKLLVGYDITETHDIMGDIRSTYAFEDFKPVDGVPFPHRVKIRGEVGNSADVEYTSVTFGENALAEPLLTLPVQEPAPSQATKVLSGDYVPLKLVPVAPGVFQAEGYSHSSMVVEFPRWLVVVEAPQTEIQSNVLGQLLRKQFPGKPVQYVAMSHPHHDHIGGVRALVALGATILVEKTHEVEMKRIIDARHTYPPDELERHRRSQQKVGGIEVYEGTKVISDGGRTFELHAIQFPHVATMVIAYLPGERVLFNSDVTPRVIFDAVTKLKLRPDRIVSGHTGIASFADIAKSAQGS